MFIVKAVQDGNTSDSPYTVHTCDYYNVGSAGVGQSSDKTYVWAQKTVSLFNADPSDFTRQGNCVAMLDVGTGVDHFTAIYVMNERGKTIDTIQARDR
jgi:hypothetical protein